MNFKNNFFYLLILVFNFLPKQIFCEVVNLDVAKKINDWESGYQLDISLKNTSDKEVEKWKVEFEVPTGQRLNSLWNAAFEDKAGHVIAFNPGWKNIINPGETFNIGMILSGKGSRELINFRATAETKEKTGSSIPKPLPPTPAPKPLPKPDPKPIPTEETKKSSESPKPSVSPVIGGKVMIGYFPNWYQYPPAGKESLRPKFTPNDIHADKITHINYAFLKPYTLNNDPNPFGPIDDTACGIKPSFATGIKNYKISFTDPWADVCVDRTWWGQEIKPGQVAGHIGKFQNLKKKNPHLKILASIGGWEIYEQGFPSKQFSELAADPKRRKEFIDSCVEFCKLYGFDGIDIDWEYPDFNGGRPEDARNFPILLAELNKALKEADPNLLLTIAAPPGFQHMDKINWNEVQKHVDWINIMGYDYYGAWDSRTNHDAPLYASRHGENKDKFNVDYTLNYYLDHGVPAKKLVLGMPLYGRSWAGVPNTEVVPGLPGLFVTSTKKDAGTIESGVRSLPDIVKNILPTYKRYWDDVSKVPYAYGADGVFVSYDDDESLGLKAQAAARHNLKGAMVWQLENDPIIWHAIDNIRKNLGS